VHLLVEADNKRALTRGMQSFQISAAKHLNRAVSVQSIARGSAKYREAMANRRRGTVFPDRYHQEIIKTPKQARHTLAYVLNNWRKHKEDRHDFSRTWNVDPYSSGAVFDGWKEREEAVTLWPLRETYLPLVTYLPKTWLLREGWRRHGLIRFDEVPSKRATADASAS
jgi:putative transposase